METDHRAGWASETDAPVYGLASPQRLSPPRITVNRLGPDYGNLVWQISADYRDDGLAPVTVHTILRRKAISRGGDRWAESGVREAKGLVAADLGASAQLADIADRPWEATTLALDGTDLPAEKLVTARGAGWVLELETAVIGLVGFDPGRDTIARIDLASGT